jgi:ketosteroid isomerase-like protein
MTGTGKVTVETLQRLVGAFHAHDLDAVMSVFTDDPVLELPRGPHPWRRRFQGREKVRAGPASRFAGIPGARRPSSPGRPRPAPGSCR